MQWYEYPIFSHFGETDSEGNYWQPDANLAVPWGTQITAILPGTITSVQRTSWGQTVITERLDTPLNPLATHFFVEHLHDANVVEGQTVQPGDVLGTTNYLGEGASVGVGLYSGDVYGSGDAWDILQNDLKPGGAHLLDPTSLIEDVRNGTTPNSVSPTSGSGNVFATIGQWISTNIFRSNSSVVSAVSSVSQVPFVIIGSVVLGIVALAIAVVFIMFVSV